MYTYQNGQKIPLDDAPQKNEMFEEGAVSQPSPSLQPEGSSRNYGWVFPLLFLACVLAGALYYWVLSRRKRNNKPSESVEMEFASSDDFKHF